jgi:hypothetical protein
MPQLFVFHALGAGVCKVGMGVGVGMGVKPKFALSKGCRITDRFTARRITNRINWNARIEKKSSCQKAGLLLYSDLVTQGFFHFSLFSTKSPLSIPMLLLKSRSKVYNKVDNLTSRTWEATDFLTDFGTQTRGFGWYGMKSPSKVQSKLEFFSVWIEPKSIGGYVICYMFYVLC